MTPIYRADHFDAADIETGFDPVSGETTRSAEFVRRDKVIKAALRIKLFSKSGKQALRNMRKHIAGLQLAMHRLVRLNDLVCSEVWPSEAWGPRKPDHTPMPGNGCTHGQWRDAAFLVHRAALSILLEPRPASYSDVHDQIRMLFHATHVSLEEEQRRKLRRRFMGHVARLVDGLPFADHPTH